MKIMLQFFILSMLFQAYNSLALALYDDIDDHSRWRRGIPSIATTAEPKTSDSKDFPDGCRCNGYIVPFTVYAKPGEQTVRINLPEPQVLCTNYAKKTVSPPNNSEFKLGRHAIAYSYSYAGYKKNLKCFVNFTVAACECPSTQTVNAIIEPGKHKASVSWVEPTPTCPTYPSAQNPQKTSKRFPFGKHVVTYKYRHERGFQNFEVKCHVNISVTGTICGAKAYDPATHVCCCNRIHQKNPGYECCGKKYRNPSKKICRSKSHSKACLSLKENGHVSR